MIVPFRRNNYITRHNNRRKKEEINKVRGGVLGKEVRSERLLRGLRRTKDSLGRIGKGNSGDVRMRMRVRQERLCTPIVRSLCCAVVVKRDF